MKVKTALEQSRAQVRFLTPVALVTGLAAILTLSAVVIFIAAALLLFLFGEVLNVLRIQRKVARNPEVLDDEIQ